MSKIRILTYNIHKGFSIGNRRFVLRQIRDSIKTVHADVVLLQEVLGSHERHSKKIKSWPASTQFEFLADQTWHHFTYGKNAVTTQGDHGNAILSKFPIIHWGNIDISLSKIERRGLLYAELDLPEIKNRLYVFCIHLGLFEKDRQTQIGHLIGKVLRDVPADSPLVIAGDFNDWRQNISPTLFDKLKLKEAFLEMNGKHATTFPDGFPVLCLDRIYYKNLKCLQVQSFRKGSWKKLSDHVPLLAEFEF